MNLLVNLHPILSVNFMKDLRIKVTLTKRLKKEIKKNKKLEKIMIRKKIIPSPPTSPSLSSIAQVSSSFTKMSLSPKSMVELNLKSIEDGLQSR